MSSDKIEQEAREAQKACGFLAQPSDLFACQHERSCAAFHINEITGYFDGAPCDCGAERRWADLAAKRMRAYEQKIEELQSLRDNLLTERANYETCIEERDKKVEELRAQVKELEGWVKYYRDIEKARGEASESGPFGTLIP